jgi:hypothetical protein
MERHALSNVQYTRSPCYRADVMYVTPIDIYHWQEHPTIMILMLMLMLWSIAKIVLFRPLPNFREWSRDLWTPCCSQHGRPNDLPARDPCAIDTEWRSWFWNAFGTFSTTPFSPRFDELVLKFTTIRTHVLFESVPTSQFGSVTATLEQRLSVLRVSSELRKKGRVERLLDANAATLQAPALQCANNGLQVSWIVNGHQPAMRVQ